MEHTSGLVKALSMFEDSPTKLAHAIGGDVLRQHIEHWVKASRVPADYCPSIELATGGQVRCEELRPDVQWSVLRDSPRTVEA